MKHSSRFLIFCGLLLACEARAQMAFLPPASLIVIGASAREIARCEVEYPMYAGKTEQYIREVAQAVPGAFDATSALVKAEDLVVNARRESSAPPTVKKCEALFDSVIPHVLVELPCLSRQEQRKAGFQAEFSAARQVAGRYVPCTGIGIGEPEGSDVCKRESAPLVVEFVEEGSPAQLAGVLPGDVILQVNTKKFTYWRDLELEELRAGIGSEIRIILKRNSSDIESKLHVGKRDLGVRSSLACVAK